MATAKSKFTPVESWEALKELPHEVELVVTRGWRDGREQFTSDFKHEDRRFRLVINQGSHKLHDGETWNVRLNNTPNGHVIFCSAVAKVADAPNPLLRILEGVESDEEALGLIPEDHNIFGLMDTGDDDAADSEMSAEDLEGRIIEMFSGKE